MLIHWNTLLDLKPKHKSSRTQISSTTTYNFLQVIVMARTPSQFFRFTLKNLFTCNNKPKRDPFQNSNILKPKNSNITLPKENPKPKYHIQIPFIFIRQINFIDSDIIGNYVYYNQNDCANQSIIDFDETTIIFWLKNHLRLNSNDRGRHFIDHNKNEWISFQTF